MTTQTVAIEKLVNWSEPKRVETKHGPRDLLLGEPTGDFWDAWRSDKQGLKDAGISCGKDEYGNWEAKWWRPISEEEAQQINEAIDQSLATDADVDIPHNEGMDYLPYQRAGIQYGLDRSNVLIADEMGLGKTIQAIGIINAVPSIKRVLVICPASLKLNWKRELEKWLVRDMEVSIISGTKAKDWRPSDVVIINYDILQKHRKSIDELDWDLLIGDEVHLCKNQQAQRTRALFGWKTKKGEIKQTPIKARRKVYLTGTPIVNRPKELWTLVESIDPTGLGASFFKFHHRYTDAHHNGYGWDFNGHARLDELHRKLRSSFMVRRMKSDVLADLPAKQRSTFVLPNEEMSELEQRILDACGNADDLLEELKKVSFEDMSRVRYEIGVKKVDAVIDVLEQDLQSGPVVCFAHHKEVISRIAEHFGDRCVTVTGDTSMEKRQANVDAFQAGKVELFVGNIQAAGVGITLTRSSHVVFAELDWVPGNMTQAEDRCHRIGQRDSVTVKHVVLEKSLDEKLSETLIQKQSVISEALDNTEGLSVNGSKVSNLHVKVETNKPKTVTIKPKEELYGDYTKQQVEAIHTGLKMLARTCDGARAQDGCGFNKRDSNFGKSLASQASLSEKQIDYGLRLVVKYQRQLPAALLTVAKGE